MIGVNIFTGALLLSHFTGEILLRNSRLKSSAAEIVTGLPAILFLVLLHACSSAKPTSADVSAWKSSNTRITQEGRKFEDAKKHAYSRVRRACVPNKLSETLKRSNISFKFIDIRKYKQAEESLDLLAASAYLYKTGGAQHLYKRRKFLNARIKALEERGRGRNKNMMLQSLASLDEIELYLNPPFTEEKLREHQSLTSRWVNNAIENLQKADLTWPDYAALKYIDEEWIRTIRSACVDWRPLFYDKTTGANALVEKRMLDRLGDALENKLYALLMSEKSNMKSEILNIFTDRDLTVFFYKYLSGYGTSYKAMKRSGMHDLYVKRWREFRGDDEIKLPKYRNN